MQIIKADNVYSLVLTEDEWYAGTDQQREAWQVQAQREASEAQCRYVCILVEPDPIMSMAPIARRHAVWRYSAPTNAEEDFKAALFAVVDLHKSNVSIMRQRALAKEVFG